MEKLSNKLISSYKVVGAKAGDKPRQPKIAKDTVSSLSTAKILYGLNDGEISGIVGNAKGIYLEDTPLEDESGNKNREDVKWDFRAGTIDQEYIEGFPDLSNEIPVSVELKSGTDWIKAVSNNSLSAVRLRFSWNGLRETNTENGDVKGYKIEYAIDVKTGSGAYQEALRTFINDKVTGKYEKTHRIELPKSSNGWQIRVRRITPNANLDNIFDKMYIEAITEVIDQKFTYPHTTLLGIQYDATTFSRIAKLAVRAKGKLINIPSNYDSVTNTYSGIWNGQFKYEYSNNPAWIFYDIATSKRYGLGRRIDASMIDKWSLYELGMYCDSLVPDGEGGEEKRYTCNVYLQSQEDAYKVLSQLSGIFRGMTYWNGHQLVLTADTPKEPVYIFSNSNMVDGLPEYVGTAKRDRHTVAKVAWDNPNENFKTEYELIRDESFIAKFGINIIDISAIGCTSRGQAQRAGLWALKSELLETRTITFRTGLEAHNVTVGDVIEVADSLYAGRDIGGRVVSVASNLKSVTVDREAIVKVDDFISINAKDGLSQRRKVIAVEGRLVTVLTPFVAIEAGSVWALNSSDLQTMQFRIMSIKPDENNVSTISGIQHEPLKYDAVDNGADVKPTNVSILKPRNVEPPASVDVSATYRVVQAQSVATLVIQWSQVKDAVGYGVEWRRDSGNWIKIPTTGNVSAEVEGVYSGNYQVRVKSINAFDVESNYITSSITPIAGKVGDPKALANLSATGLLFGMAISWSFQAGSEDTNYTEIETATDASGANRATLGSFSYPTNKTEVTGLQGGLKVFYRGRILDKLGNVSVWSNWVSGTTSEDASKVLDILQGEITQSQLYTDLSAKIDSIDTNKTILDGLGIEVNTDIAEIRTVIDSNLLSTNTAINNANLVISNNKTEVNTAIAEANVLIKANKDKLILTDSTIENNRTVLNTEIQNTKDIVASETINRHNEIVAEAEARVLEDGLLRASIVNESQARQTATGALTTQFNGIYAQVNPKLIGNETDLIGNEGNFVGVWSEQSARIEGDLSLGIRVDGLLARTDTNTASITEQYKVLTDKDTALASSITTLSTDFNSNKSTVNNTLLSLSNTDSTLASSISTLETNYNNNKAAVSNQITVLTDKDTSLTNSINSLTSTVGTNTASISNNYTTLVNADTATNNLLTTLDSEYKTNKASVNTSLTTLTNKDISLTNSINSLTSTVGTNTASIGTINTTLATNTQSIATNNTEINAKFDNLVIGGKNYILNSKLNTIVSSSSSATAYYFSSRIKTDREYTFSIKIDIGNSVTALDLYNNTGQPYGRLVLNASTGNYELTFTPNDYTAYENENEGLRLYPRNVNASNPYTVHWVKLELGNKATDWTPAPEDVAADIATNTASISSESTARANADTALTNTINTLTSRVGTAEGTITTNNTALVAKDTALTNSLNALTTTVGNNTSAITTEATTRTNADNALSTRITTNLTKADSALSRISTAETTIASNTQSIAQTRTDLTANYTTAIATAKTQSNDYTDLKSSIVVIDSLTKRFINPAKYASNASNAIGYLIIETPIGNSKMVSIKISGYNYLAAEANIDLNLGFYTSSGNVVNANYESKGSYPINKVQVAKLGSSAVIIIGLPTNSWKYPKIVVDEALIGYQNPPDSYKDGWNTFISTDISSYTNVVDINGTELLPAISSNSAAITTESTARANADSALSSTITTLQSDYNNNKSSVTNSLTALTTKDTALTNSLNSLTTTVGNNSTNISTEITARTNADNALGTRITATEAVANNAQSRVGTAETAISTANSSIANLRTDLTASYTVKDTRSTDELPSYYYSNFPSQTVKEFKTNSVFPTVLGTGTYIYLETVIKFSTSSGGAIVQTATTDDNRRWSRTSLNTTTWNAWAEQRADILYIDSKTKKFFNPVSYANEATNTGYLIIETPILANRMVNLNIGGYNYADNKTQIDIDISFYFSSTIARREYTSRGTYPIDSVQVAKLGTTAVIIIGLVNSVWVLPKISVREALIGYTLPPDSYKDGWIMKVATDLTPYTVVTALTGKNIQQELTDNTAAITSEVTARANAVSAVASSVSTLQTTVDGHTSSIQTQQTSINGLNAQYTVKVDVGGRVSGFGLASSSTQSDFAVRADKFYIAPVSGTSKGVIPFMVTTATSTINGTSVPAGTYIQSAYIHDGSIDSAKIKDASITTAKIANLAVNTAQIANAAIDNAKIADAAITTAKIGTAQIDTLQIKGDAVTVARAQFIPTYTIPHTQYAVHTLSTLSIDAGGGNVLVDFGFDTLYTQSRDSNRAGDLTFEIYRDGTLIKSIGAFTMNDSETRQTGSANNGTPIYTTSYGQLYTFISVASYIDSPSSGSHTYVLKVVRGYNTDSHERSSTLTNTTFRLSGAKR